MAIIWAKDRDKIKNEIYRSSMVIFTLSKINLGLRILRKRPDGYHALSSVFYPVGWGDVVELIKAPKGSGVELSMSGMLVAGEAEDNICYRAASMLQDEFQLGGMRLHLHKVVPMGAGLGGGSADGVAVLQLINEVFALNLGQAQLLGYAARLGSDCPFFVSSCPSLVQGRGESIHPIDLSLHGLWILMVYPNLSISTAKAFAKVRPYEGAPLPEEAIYLPIEKWKDAMVNDFEQGLFEEIPVLAEIKKQFYNSGALYASMSGSGSVMYGLFAQAPPTALVHAWQQKGWQVFKECL